MLPCHHTREQGVDIVAIRGRFVQDDMIETRKLLIDLVETGSGKMVVTLRRTTYLDSYALATFILMQKAMQKRGGRIILASLSPDLEALIELTRLQSVFEIVPTEESAIRVLSAAPDESVGDSSEPQASRRGKQPAIENEQQESSGRERRGEPGTHAPGAWNRLCQFKLWRLFAAEAATSKA